MADRGAVAAPKPAAQANRARPRLSDDDREMLARWAEGGAGDLSSPGGGIPPDPPRSRRAVRARIVLACDELAASDAEVAAALGVSRPTVACWRRRFAQAGLAGLADAERCGRPKAVLELTGAERAQLTRWARRGSTGQTLALRARIVLACAAGKSNKETSAQLHTTEAVVARWRRRFLAGRLAGLADRPRPGRPRTPTMPSATAPPQAPEGRKEFIPTISTARLHPVGNHAAAAGQALLAAERRDLLLTRLRRDGKLIAKDLAAEFGLSEDSVRRDLRELAAAGLCQRVYGGALPASPLLGSTQALRSRLAPHSKRRVGARAAQFITPGSTVILEGGTTALEVVKALPPDLEATIITPSVATAAALADHPGVEVIMLSGWLDKASVAATGATAAEAAGAITADLALLIMSAIHPHEGLTAADPEHAAMKRILASRAAASYVMASTEKLGTVLPYKITSLSEIAGIITDAPDHPTIRQLRDQGTTIIQAR